MRMKKKTVFSWTLISLSSNLHGIRALGFRSGKDSSSTVSYLANGRFTRRTNTQNPNVHGTDRIDVPDVPETQQSKQIENPTSIKI